MSKTVQVTLPDELEVAIEAAAADGEYASAADLVLNALENWRAERPSASVAKQGQSRR